MPFISTTAAKGGGSSLRKIYPFWLGCYVLEDERSSLMLLWTGGDGSCYKPRQLKSTCLAEVRCLVSGRRAEDKPRLLQELTWGGDPLRMGVASPPQQ